MLIGDLDRFGFCLGAVCVLPECGALSLARWSHVWNWLVWFTATRPKAVMSCFKTACVWMGHFLSDFTKVATNQGEEQRGAFKSTLNGTGVPLATPVRRLGGWRKLEKPTPHAVIHQSQTTTPPVYGVHEMRRRCERSSCHKSRKVKHHAFGSTTSHFFFETRIAVTFVLWWSTRDTSSRASKLAQKRGHQKREENRKDTLFSFFGRTIGQVK